MKKLNALFLILMGLSIFGLRTSAQVTALSCGPFGVPPSCTQCVTVNPSSATECPGSAYTFIPSITLPPGYSIASYTWSPTTGVLPLPGYGTGAPGSTSITPPTPSLLPPACSNITYPYALTVTALAANEVTNWDFSLGGVDYCYNFGYVTGPIGVSQETVCSDASSVLAASGYAGPSPFYDHTFGTAAGSMIVAYGDPNPTLVWQQVEYVCPGEQYQFACWLANLNIPSASTTNLILEINDGISTTSLSVSSSFVYTWEQPSSMPLNYTAPAGVTTATVSIVESGRNAFALDDITFKRVCTSTGTMSVTVNYPAIIATTTAVCVGSTIPLTGCPGAIWSSGATTIATVDPMGNVTGIAAGTATISMTDAYGCTATTIVTVEANPTISGPNEICEFSNATFMGSGVTGTGVGTWTWSGGFLTYYYMTPPYALFVGSGAGVSTITYTDPTTGCYGTTTLTVDQMPSALPPLYLCLGTLLDLNALPPSPPGGIWSPAVGPVATISGGIVTPTTPGVETITYTLPGPTPLGCYVTTPLDVIDCSGGGGLIGSGAICLGNSETYTIPTGVATGGTWTATCMACITVTGPNTMVYTPTSTGVQTITYTPPGGGPIWTITVTVYGPATGCVYVTGGVTPYYFNFTSSCPGATLYFNVEDISGTVLGSGSALAGSSIAYTSISATYGPTAYTICVYEVYCAPCTWFPTPCCASVNPSTTGVPGIGNIGESLMVVPNPNDGTFVLTGTMDNSSGSNYASLEIVDILGKVVYKDVAVITNGNINQSITLSKQLPNGLYFIKVKNDDDNKVIRFVLTR